MQEEQPLRHDPDLSKTFPKEERLHSKKLIDGLFSSKGSSFLVYPFKVVHQYVPEAGPKVQMLVVVPKRGFKKAHDRNRLKRQIREAYRLQKNRISHLPEKEQLNLLGFIYIAKEKLPFCKIKNKLSAVLDRCLAKEQ